MKTRLFSVALILLGMSLFCAHARAGERTLRVFEYKLVPANLVHADQIFRPKPGAKPCGMYFMQEDVIDLGSGGKVPSVFFQHQALNGRAIDEAKDLALPGKLRRIVSSAGDATATITFAVRSVFAQSDPFDFHWDIKMPQEEWDALDQMCPELGRAIQPAK